MNFYTMLQFSLFVFFITSMGLGQTILGTNGLVTVPVAYIPDDGDVFIGCSLMNKNHGRLWSDDHHRVNYYASVSYLPFMEIGLRVARHPGYTGLQGIGDRMVSVRVQVLRERKIRPAVALGVHDLIGTKLFNALYLVASKGFRLNRSPPFEIHLGYGTDWFKAERHEFVGLFGGVSVEPITNFHVMIEYDTEKWNSGVRVLFFDHLQIFVAFLGFDSVSGGVSYQFRLK